MKSDPFEDLLNCAYTLTPRPFPVPGDMRPDWRIVTCLMIINSVRGKKAALEQIHFLGHAIRRRKNRALAMAVIESKTSILIFPVRVDPALGVALAMAVGLGFVRLEKGKSYKLTDDGIQLLELLNQDPSLFQEERAFLNAVGKKVTQVRWRELMPKEKTE
ncbi:MAG: hypothetical protein HQL69_22675 [Magnetococcales bacterium]|nr:hypothetical protein [Magnetococcales bacterium]